jgi:hypothetical protein
VGAWVPVAVVPLVACMLAAGSAASARETYKLDIHELGAPESSAAPTLSMAS